MDDFFKERSLGELIKDSFNFLKIETKPIVQILLVFVAPFALYGIYFMFKYQVILEKELLNSFQTQNFSNMPTQFYIFLGFGFLQQILITLAIGAYLKIRIRYNKEAILLSDIFKEIILSFTNVFAGQMFVFTVIFASFFLTAIIGIISYVFLFLLIWSVYVIVSMYLLSFIIIFEDVTIVTAIKKSLFLIKGNWWVTFGVIIVIGIFVGLSDMTFSGVIKSIIQIFSTSDIAAIIVLSLSSFVSLFLSAFSIISTGFLYASYVTQKENVTI